MWSRQAAFYGLRRRMTGKLLTKPTWGEPKNYHREGDGQIIMAFFLYPETDNRNYLHLTILYLTLSIHKQISYFILFPWQHLTFHVHFFFSNEGKVKITLSVKLNIFPSPHLFYSQTLRRHGNFTFLSEVQRCFPTLDAEIKWLPLQLLLLSPVCLQRKPAFLKLHCLQAAVVTTATLRGYLLFL